MSTPSPEPSNITHPLLEALRFLTVLPIPGTSAMTERDVAASIPWFPVAGLLIGLLLLPMGWLAGAGWGPEVRAACLVVAWGVITAGLHLDGLSDTFDAVASWRSRERKLEIMKDSHVGAMGVLAIAAVLLLKFVWLLAAGDDWWSAVLLAAVWGRWADIYGIFWFPAAREGGLGRAFREYGRRRDFFIVTATAILLSLLLSQWQGLVAGLLVWACAHLLARWWTRDLGGLTGDTYGALCELCEVVALAVLAF
jgi:adenosylcobinamide-GDP ribazoletransferase